MVERARIGGQSEVVVGPGVLTEGLATELAALGLKGRVFVFSDDRVFPLHGERLLAAIRADGREASARVFPAGEPTKSLDTAFGAYDWLVERRAERGDAILALGGGVVGDLSGFVAATYLRGLPLVHAPTTLLAQIDSSIGGKAAVNHPRGKNLVGAFYPARLVLVDPRALLTLPRRDLASGWAEVVKTAMILDPEMLDLLVEQSRALLEPDLDPTTEVIRRSIQHKVDVVAEDPTERGRRVILNYGHTIAHALESATGYGQLLHGEAVAIGMRGAARISCRLGLLAESDAARQGVAVAAFGLPSRVRDLGVEPPPSEAVLGAMLLDKKVQERAVRWVLLEGIGRTTVRSDVPASLVREVVEELL
jgi:3-dehydroquinate synthase